MRDIADDGDAQAFQRGTPVEYGARVEERLRGMFVSAVAGIDDGRLHQVARQKVRSAGGRVAHHDSVGVHGAQGVQRVHQRFALGNTGARGGDGDGVGAQSLGGDFETSASARGGLEEQIYNHAAAQLVRFAPGRLLRLKTLGAVEDGFDLDSIQRLDSQQSTGHHASLGLLHQQYFVVLVDFLEFHFNDLIGAGLHHAADVAGLDGELAPAAID